SQATRGGLIYGCWLPRPSADEPVPPPVLNGCDPRGTMFGTGGQPLQYNFGQTISNPYMADGGDWQKSRNDNLQSLTLDMERATTFGRVSFDLTDNVTAFTELGWSKTRAKNSHSLQTF